MFLPAYKQFIKYWAPIALRNPFMAALAVRELLESRMLRYRRKSPLSAATTFTPSLPLRS